MPLETAQFIHQLNPANPASSDRLQNGDDHIRMVKAAIRATFPNLTGAVELDQAFLNALKGNLVPTGAITLFYGSTAPSGWAICNGQIVPRTDGTGNITTPDLRGRVALGVSEAYALGSLYGQATVTATTEVAGAHTPTGAGTLPEQPERTASLIGNATSAKTGATVSTVTRKVDDGGSASGLVTTVTLTDPGHAHAVTGTATIPAVGAQAVAFKGDAVAGHSHAVKVDTLQPSVALNYIIKV